MKRLLACVWIGLTAAGCGGDDGGGTVVSFGAGPDQASVRPVATVDQVMDAIVIPSSQAIFDAVVYENGELVTAPRSDDDWFRLQMHAIALAEAGNLLLLPTRNKGEADWVSFSHALTDEAIAVSKAAEAKDVEGLLAAGSDVYRACTACHAKYLPME